MPERSGGERRELERREVTDQPSFGFDCLGCGRRIFLFFNGGELDRADCCGYRYETEHARIDFVISKLPAPVHREEGKG